LMLRFSGFFNSCQFNSIIASFLLSCLPSAASSGLRKWVTLRSEN